MDVETLYVPFGASFTPQFKDEQPQQYERYFRIRSTATRLEAMRHPRRPSAKTVAERAQMLEAVKQIKSPMVIITGELDTALEAAKTLHEVRPDAPLHVMPGAPHNAYFEMPDQWNAVARTFLDQVMAAAV